MSTLNRAIIIAAEGHADALDKGGAPYILHPLRVMLSLSTIDERIVGILHEETTMRFDSWLHQLEGRFGHDLRSFPILHCSYTQTAGPSADAARDCE